MGCNTPATAAPTCIQPVIARAGAGIERRNVAARPAATKSRNRPSASVGEPEFDRSAGASARAIWIRTRAMRHRRLAASLSWKLLRPHGN